MFFIGPTATCILSGFSALHATAPNICICFLLIWFYFWVIKFEYFYSFISFISIITTVISGICAIYEYSSKKVIVVSALRKL